MPSRSRLALALIATVAAGGSLAACHPRTLADVHIGDGGVHVATMEPMATAVTVAPRLDCPSEVGVLKRTAIAGDGTSCDYSSNKGVVHLSTVDAQTDAKGALSPLRDQLDGELPGVAANATIQVVSEKGVGGAEHTKVDMPFIHVEDDGDKSHVRLLGIDIKSDSKHRHHDKDDDGDEDTVTSSNTTATVTAANRGVELVYVLVSGKPSAAGYHVMGYVAKGPPKGKLVVATFRYVKGEKTWSDGDRHDDDVDALMRLNVKPA